MRIIFSGLFLLIAFISFGQASINPKGSVNIDSLMEANAKAAIGRPFPEFEATNEHGRINKKAFKGKVILVNFWFEDCHPCMAEMEALNELYRKLKDRKDFEFVSFTRDNAEAINRVKEKFGLQFKIFSINDAECRRLNQNNGYPTSIVVDKNGKIAYLVCGGPTDKDKAREFVMSKLLSEITNIL
ncbi:TlpA family protein disulfide reductase [Chitinophagaceae bacterium LB-8]|uniref:TlpA family protein disulfide reductase n=1 Tax=Paraflavisolibacter caeni TaxID=2982496 RepID=A0A9X2XYJ1_9BACT|nr:TlpA disulfide reductase family protein [Paraflavisolibacter caeni]MCU7551172.1 TlpA family protein disulfide reductase [Paraflavisolibacter caeni]